MVPCRSAHNFLNTELPFPPLSINYRAGDEKNKKDVNEAHAVSKVLNHRMNDNTGCIEYLVQWYGYDNTFDEWVPEHHMSKSDMVAV